MELVIALKLVAITTKNSTLVVALVLNPLGNFN